MGRRMFTPKRLVIYIKDGKRTLGILLREGASGGTNGATPTLSVCEIRTTKVQRDTTDLLPYLPKFRKLFTGVLLDRKEPTKNAQIPITDLECVTTTMVKGVIPEVYGNHREDAYRVAKNNLMLLCRDWDADELDWSKIKDLKLRELVQKRIEAMAIAQKAECLGCPQFLKHVSP